MKPQQSGRIPRTRLENVALKREPTTRERCPVVDSDYLLPMVDPIFLIIERDPQKLHAFARGLLHRLFNRSQHYPLVMVKAATAWLVGAYIDARVPLAPEMRRLISGIAKWNPRASTFRNVQEKNEDAYWAAIRFESARPTDPTGKAPSVATLYSVAKYVREGVGFPQQGTRKPKNEDSEQAHNAAQKSAEATIRGWRKLDHYRQNVRYQRNSDT
jgi:hypothetical protein